MLGDLLHTKFYVPPLQRSFVPRPRLIERLDQGLQRGHKLFLLTAPAGYGKSTLVLQWLETKQRPIAWLSLDNNDDDPRRFLTYVVAALNYSLPDFGEEIFGLLRTAGQEVALQTVSTIILNQLAGLETTIILVLDDYHVISAPAVHEILALWLDHLPPNLHLVMTSRHEPELPLSRLRARGQLTEINSQSLRFTVQETDTYLRKTKRFKLSEEDVITLAERTEGRPACNWLLFPCKIQPTLRTSSRVSVAATG